MTRVLKLFLITMLVAASVFAAQKRAQAHESSPQYVDLAGWGRTNSFRIVWNSNGRDFMLTNRSWRLAFTVNSRQAEINGVKAWLSFPVIARGTNASIALLDIQKLIRPLLTPARNNSQRKVTLVALDPGHGGKDKGVETAGCQEKTHTLLLARRLQSLLESAGLKVVLTRSSDVFVELDDRVALAKRRRADIFVSLHYNSDGNGRGDAKGVECYCVTPAGAKSTNTRPDDNATTKAVPGNNNDSRNVLLAYLVQKAMVTGLDVEDRGVRRARFLVLRDATMPAILIEGGFMSAPDERRRLVGLERRRDLAQAIADGILDYKRLVERQ
jgi:N-acetylmuramoyl-L-alanine amidase